MGEAVAGEREQGSVRITLWKNGFFAGLSSPLFGLGPGAFSGLSGPFGRFEAHNSMIDWFASAGLVGIVSFGWLIYRCWPNSRLVLSSNSANAPLLSSALIAGLLVFSAFHFTFRQPLYWFYIVVSGWMMTSCSPRRIRPRSPRTQKPRN